MCPDTGSIEDRMEMLEEITSHCLWSDETYVSFPRDLTDVKQIRQRIYGLHTMFGCPPVEKLESFLRKAGYSEIVLRELKNMSFQTLEDHRLPKQHNVTKFNCELTTNFNDKIQVDIFYVRGKPILHFVDECTKFSLFHPLNSRNTDDIIEGLIEWMGLFGMPKEIKTDPESSIISERCTNFSNSIGVRIDDGTTPDSHWISGLVERHNATGKIIIKKLISSNTTAKLSFNTIVKIAQGAKNGSHYYGQVTPAQATFGLHTPISDRNPDSIGSETLEFQRLRMIECARKFVISHSAQSKIMRALNRRKPGKRENYKPGDLVDIFQTKSKSWTGPYRVLTVDGGKLYLNSGHRIIQRNVTLVKHHIANNDKVLETMPVFFAEDESEFDMFMSSTYVTEECGDKPEFRVSDKKELDSIESNGVLEAASAAPPGAVILPARMIRIFKSCGLAKSRLVAGGHKDPRIDLERTAPTPKRESVRLMMAYAVSHGVVLKCFDVKTAFLQGSPLDRDIYIKIQNDKNLDERYRNKLFKLKKCLYGLREAGLCWLSEFFSVLKSKGLKQSKTDSCLWYYEPEDKKGTTSYLLIYVDDGLIVSSCSEMDRIIQDVAKEIKFGTFGKLKRFLGIDIDQSESEIVFNSLGYAEKLVRDAEEILKVTEGRSRFGL